MRQAAALPQHILPHVQLRTESETRICQSFERQNWHTTNFHTNANFGRFSGKTATHFVSVSIVLLKLILLHV